MNGYLTTFASYVLKPSKRKLIRYSSKFKGLTGLEIGGPSALFSLRGYFPVYLFARRIDGVNYSNETVWEGRIEPGETYKYYNKKGFQFIQEAADLSNIDDASYDFLLSCHSLEHVANPLKALKEWNRVVKPGGYFVLVLPDKRNTFDYYRPYTTMKHLLSDYNNGTDEHDETHFEEVIEYHDPARQDSYLSWEKEKERIQNNYQFRCVHHHVFNSSVVKEMLQFASFEIIYQQDAAPFHLIYIARKLNNREKEKEKERGDS